MYCITIIADKNKEVTSFPYHSKKLEFILCIVSRQFVKTWTKWTLDILYKNSHFFVTTGLNLMGFSAKCR